MTQDLVVKYHSLMMPLPTGSLDQYIHAAMSIPVLSAEEEHALAVRLQSENDLEAARRLVMAHLRFVVRIARGYSGYGLALGDLIQEGNIGLMKAVKRFDPNQGVRLVSFAVHWIKAEMHEYVLRNWRIVKVATTKAQRKLFFNLRSNKKRLSWLTGEETAAIAEDLGVSEQEVTRMEGRLAASDMAFDGYPDTNDDEAGAAPVHFLALEDSDPADLVAAEDEEASNSERLALALNELDQRSREIVERRWLRDDKQTLHELAEEYGVSAERIRQIEKNALQKLKLSVAA